MAAAQAPMWSPKLPHSSLRYERTGWDPERTSSSSGDEYIPQRGSGYPRGSNTPKNAGLGGHMLSQVAIERMMHDGSCTCCTRTMLLSSKDASVVLQRRAGGGRTGAWLPLMVVRYV